MTIRCRAVAAVPLTLVFAATAHAALYTLPTVSERPYAKLTDADGARIIGCDRF